MSLATDCVTLPEHVVQACNIYKKGGNSAIAIINEDASIPDFTSAADWQTAIDLGKVKIIKNIKATIPKGNPVEGENALACGAEKILDGFDRQITWKDFNVNATNDAFYAELCLKRAYLAVYNCNESEIIIIDLECNFAISDATSPEGNREKQSYEGMATWYQNVGWYSTRYPAPVGIFIA